MEHMLRNFSRSGSEYLGLRLPASGAASQVARLMGGSYPPAALVRAGRIEEWRPNGLTEADGELFIYGPPLSGQPLSALLDFASERDSLGLLAELAEAFDRLAAAGWSLGRFYPQGILRLAPGDFLILPDSIMEKVNAFQPVAERLAWMERFNHPDSSGAQAISFSLAILAYRLVAGEYPFAGGSPEELRTAVRERPPAGLQARRPELRTEVVELISDTLVSTPAGRPALAAWKEALRDWQARGTSEKIDETERARRRELAARRDKRSSGSYSSREFWRKNGMRVALIAAGLALVGSLAGSILGNLLKPRAIHGFPPERVVETFYGGINKLDHLTMEDCLIDGAGKSYVNEAMNLFVISRMRMSVENADPIVDARVWDERGRPVPAAGKLIYGVVGLAVRESAAPPGEKAFEASFERWGPRIEELPSGDQSSGAASSGTRIVEKLSLRKHKEDWLIYRIERLEEKPVGTVRPAAPPAQ